MIFENRRKSDEFRNIELIANDLIEKVDCKEEQIESL